MVFEGLGRALPSIPEILMPLMGREDIKNMLTLAAHSAMAPSCDDSGWGEVWAGFPCIAYRVPRKHGFV